jgi:hypothetical protein
MMGSMYFEAIGPQYVPKFGVVKSGVRTIPIVAGCFALDCHPKKGFHGT